MKSLLIHREADETVLTLINTSGDHSISCGHGKWTEGRTGFEAPALTDLGVTAKNETVPCAACGAWTTDDTFVAKLCYTESPFTETMTFQFSEDKVTFNQIVHPAFNWDARQQDQLVGSDI